MKTVLIALTTLGFAACVAKKETSSVEAGRRVEQHMLDCTGSKMLDAVGNGETIRITADRSRFDKGSGIPVDIVAEIRHDMGTATPGDYKPLLKTTGRLSSNDREINLTFKEGSLEAAIFNSGIVGGSPIFRGPLKITTLGKELTVSCSAK